MSNIKEKKVNEEVEITPGQFLDNEGDIIADEFLSIFEDFPNILKDKNLINQISGLFYNDIKSVRMNSYKGSLFMDFGISTLPGQCSTLVVHDYMVSHECYELFLKIITKLAIGLNFSNILITSYEEHKLNPELVEDGFELFKQKYRNNRTGNLINYYMKYLN
jgi:hypothetical protein